MVFDVESQYIFYIFLKVVTDLLMCFLMLNRSVFFTFFWMAFGDVCLLARRSAACICLVAVVMHTKCLHDYVR